MASKSRLELANLVKRLGIHYNTLFQDPLTKEILKDLKQVGLSNHVDSDPPPQAEMNDLEAATRGMVSALMGETDNYYGMNDLGLREKFTAQKAAELATNLVKSGFMVSFYSKKLDTDNDLDAGFRNYNGYQGRNEATPELKYAISKAFSGVKDEASTPGVGVALIFRGSVAPSTTDSEIVSLFSNVCTTLNMSMALPFLDIKIITNLVTDDIIDSAAGVGLPFSMTRFLNFSTAVGDDQELYLKAVKAGRDPTLVAEDEESKSWVVSSGMESFLSPQTMVNADQINTAVKGQDTFRPFMSIIDFSINVSGLTGFDSEKTAQLKLKLHDKTRLSEISNLISPDRYGTTRFRIEYGWSLSPTLASPTSENLPAQLINSMRSIDTFNIITASFSISGTEVDIDLELISIGSAAQHETDVAIQGSELNLEDLQNDLQNVRKKLSMLKKGALKKIQVPKMLNSANVTSTFSLNDKDLQKIRGFQTKLKNAKIADTPELLDKIFGTAGTVASIRTKRSSLVQTRLNELEWIEDPFINFGHRAFDNVKNPEPSDYISLGYLMTAFMGPALNDYNGGTEVLFVFGCSNHNSAAQCFSVIAEFPLKRQRVKEILTKLFTTNEKISVRQFFSAVAGDIVGDQAAFGYGLSSLIAQQKSKKVKKSIKKLKAVEDKKERLIRSFYIDEDASVNMVVEPNFTPMQIVMKVDSGPQASFNAEVGKYRYGVNRNVIRINIFDQAHNPDQVVDDVISSPNGAFFLNRRFARSSENPWHPHHYSTAQNQMFETANPDKTNTISEQGATIREIDAARKIYRLESSPATFKKILMRNYPCLQYGGEGSAIITADLSMQTDSEVFSARISGGSGGTRKPSDREPDDRLPMYIVPSELSITMFGCPFLGFSQKYFIDFGTNSDLDQFYGVVGVDHTIQKGSFTTSLRLVHMGSYSQFRSVQSDKEVLKAIIKDDFPVK